MREALGFSVFHFWSFLRSFFSFVILHSKNAVFLFWYPLRFSDFAFFDSWFSVFINKKACVFFSVFLFACLVPRPHRFGSLFSAVFRFRWKLSPNVPLLILVQPTEHVQYSPKIMHVQEVAQEVLVPQEHASGKKK